MSSETIKILPNGSNPPPKDSPPILPKDGERNVLITSALPYCNNVPHLGTLIGCVLSADVFARYCRLREYNTIYICGTDEYGTATETKAKAEGVTPKQLCEKYTQIHRDAYSWFNINFDHFGHTNTEHQTKIAQDIFLKLYNAEIDGEKLLNERDVEQLFCKECDRFLADRFVEGECPHCQYPDARGDQCDGCSKLLSPNELKKPRCASDGSTPEIRESTHLYLNLPKLSPSVKDFFDARKSTWSKNTCDVTQDWLDRGLEERCITRDLKWGTPVPIEKFKEKVFYVWFDAPIGYLSITAEYTEGWEKWWKTETQSFLPNASENKEKTEKNDDNDEKKIDSKVKLYQFLGKDNIPFHTVIFPASLIGANDQYTLLDTCSTTEYINYEDGKFSKSRNTGVFADHAQETGIPPFVWRYYLLGNRPEKNDTIFSWSDFMKRINGEFLASIGNLCNRAVTFAQAYFENSVPAAGELTETDKELIKTIESTLSEYIEALESVSLRDGLKIACDLAAAGNKYMQTEQPWDLIKKDNKERAATVTHLLLQLVMHLGQLLEPYVPSFCAGLRTQLNANVFNLTDKYRTLLPAGHKTGAPKALVPRMKSVDVAKWREKYSGQKAAETSPEFSLDLKVSQIKEVKIHETNDQLYVLSVDVGEEKPRQIVSGLVKHYPNADELIDRLVVVVLNLKQTKFRGVASHGMVLCAVHEDKTVLLTPPKEAKVGAAILPHDSHFNSKKNTLFNARKYWDTLKIQLDEQNHVVVAGSQLQDITTVSLDKKLKDGFKAKKAKNQDLQNLTAEAAEKKQQREVQRQKEIADRLKQEQAALERLSKLHLLYARGVNKGETEEERRAAAITVEVDDFPAGTIVK